MYKILICVLVVVMFGCTPWTRIEVGEATYERHGDIDMKNLEITFDGTEFEFSMDSAESQPEKLQKILDRLAKIIEALQLLQGKIQ